MGFNRWTTDIMDREWVVENNAPLVRILLIVHFGNPRHGYFEINVRNGKAGGLLMQTI